MKSTSPCLKEKGDGRGVSPSSVKQGPHKKRQRVVSRDSESSEEPYGIKGADKESGFSFWRNGFDHIEGDRFRKRSKLDVFEFDEYDRFDEMKDSGYDGEDSEEGGRTFLSPGDARQTQPEAGTSGGGGDIVYKRRNSFKGGSSSLHSTSSEFANQFVSRSADSLFTSKSSNASLDSIRVQGKNGVLKVQVNKRKGWDVMKTDNHPEAENCKTSKDGTVFTGNQLVHSSRALEARFDDQTGSDGRTGKAVLTLHKSMSTRTSQMQDSGSGDSDNSSKSARDFRSRKKVSRQQGKGKTTTPRKSPSAISNSRDERGKYSSGTEKQKLREHIKKMLLDAGWTIDYRPRRNRNYNDAVYVNTSGIAYWSIIKAYDALQKEASDKNESIAPANQSSFSPLPETILCKLTRKKRQKMERANKIKHQEKGGSGRPKQTSGRWSLKAKSGSEETSDEDEEEDYDEEEKLRTLKKERVKSLEAGNEFGSQHIDQVSHDEDPVCGNSKSSRLPLQGRKSRKLGRCTLLVRRANKGMNPNDGYVLYTGQRTLLSWLIDCGIVELSEKVRYVDRSCKRTLQQGWITRDGIHCVCCSEIVTIAKFEIHAGSQLRQPFQNIIIESGASLLQCLLEAWSKQAESAHNYFYNVVVDGDDPNDDTCSICGDGGDLICCDGCPSTFHQNCLGIEVLPAGDWHCPQCICAHCGVINDSDFGANTIKRALQTCSLCKKKYHFLCSTEVNICAENSSGSPFCGIECEELHKTFQKFIGLRNELEAGYSWSLIRRTVVDSNDSINTTPQNVECNAKLAVAQTIMDECFLPIVDRRSQANLIHNVLYSCGSNFKRLDYGGFYTAILEKGDEVISAASLRFHGTEFAEMPFIGTRHIYRRQGMCRRLFSAIESALCSFKVEKLIIPAISELLHTWIDVFGFHHIEQSVREKLRHVNMLVFPGIDMLQKVLIEKEQSKDEAITHTGPCNKEEIASDSMCQDPSVLINDSSIPDSPLDDEHACSEPVNGSAGYMNESCYPDEHNRVCVDDGTATNEKAGRPDSSGPPNSPHRKEFIHSEDENTSYKIKSEEMKLKSEYEMRCATDSSVADAKIKDRLMSTCALGKDVRLAEDAGNSDLLESRGPDYAEPVSYDGRVNSSPSEGCIVVITCTDMNINSKPCLEKCRPPHPEADLSSTIEIMSYTATCHERTTDEYSGDASAPQSSILSLHTSNGDIDMEDVEVLRTPNSHCHLSNDAAAAETSLHHTWKGTYLHKVSLPFSTLNATSECIAVAPDEDVEMNIDQQVVSNGVRHDEGSESAGGFRADGHYT
uniref:PHD-type domain-containing protein n=1 Tax=Kalanchoe fedtschenkoi TaxID=63787 RepID=A0A7N0VGK6_KALFE